MTARLRLDAVIVRESLEKLIAVFRSVAAARIAVVVRGKGNAWCPTHS